MARTRPIRKAPPTATRSARGLQLALTSVVMPEDDGFVSLCPELDVASQGRTIDEARENLIEAVELLLETASRDELKSRLRGTPSISPISVRRRA